MAVLVATISFVAYTRTLLPGVDLGDTGAFQASVLWPRTSARQAYPLYYGLARPFVQSLSADRPARGLNLFSAVCGAAAVGGLAWVVAAISSSVAAGAVAGLMLAFSYTFWSQAIIAEVYTLHLAMVGICLMALYAFTRRPSTATLAAFCAAYALSFGNHLSSILLFVPFLAFVFAVHPARRQLLRPSVVAMAGGIAVLGAFQYAPNFLALWMSIDAPPEWRARLAAFWFDVTKVDWRASMVLGVDSSGLADHLAMWLWDARQQFGPIGLAAAAAGMLRLYWSAPAWGGLALLAYAINTLFAVTYNVGDAHVFFLPGHYFTAFAIGVAVAPPGAFGSPRSTAAPPVPRLRRGVAYALPALGLMLAASRGWETWPAADRHLDTRGELLVARTLAGVSESQSVYVSRFNWDIENALLYSSRYRQTNVAMVRLLEILPHVPAFVADNGALGRDVVLSAQAAATVNAAYGGAIPLLPDDALPGAQPLSAVVQRLPRGTPYVLTMLSPVRSYGTDISDLGPLAQQLTGNRWQPHDAPYEVIAGLSGDVPTLTRFEQHPFRADTRVLGDPITVRMDAWLPVDTFRRGGFGHVLRGREPVLFVERGVSLVWFNPDGRPNVAYANGPYAPSARFRIAAGASRLAAR